MTFREFSGKNVEEAIRAAMSEFSAELSDLDIEILSSGSRGILGVGSEQARILAAPKSAVAQAESLRPVPTADDGPGAADDEDADAAGDQVEALARASANRERGPRARGGRAATITSGRPARGGDGHRPRPAPDGEPARESLPFVPGKRLEELSERERATLEEAQRVLGELLRLMGLPAAVEIGTSGETAKLNVTGEDLGILIGRRGEKLASLQHLVNLIVAKREGHWHRIAVDVENYRGRREEQLRDVAQRAARRVEETGKIIQLEAMPAIERRIVHVALVENPRVRTQSVGVEPNRRIVILPAEPAAT